MNRQRKVVIILLIIVLLAAISYASHRISVDDTKVNESAIQNHTNKSNFNQSYVVPLERPPFLMEERT